MEVFLGFEGQVAVFNQCKKVKPEIYSILPDPKDVPNCSLNGVLGTLPGMIGTIMAHETLKVIHNLV
jgi:adenylyltransferase/sulfurtransferase